MLSIMLRLHNILLAKLVLLLVCIDEFFLYFHIILEPKKHGGNNCVRDFQLFKHCDFNHLFSSSAFFFSLKYKILAHKKGIDVALKACLVH